jgi:hypothetical protein
VLFFVCGEWWGCLDGLGGWTVVIEFWFDGHLADF